MTRISALILLAATFAFTGCKGKTTTSEATEGKPAAASPAAAKAAGSGGGKIASCNYIKAESLCREYGEANLEAAGEQSIKDMCGNNYKGEFKLEACPKDKRVGSCVTPEGTKVFYNDGPLPLAADAAEKSCKDGIPAGEWKTG